MQTTHFDVIIVGGASSGLSAALVLARSLRTVLVIDGGQPSNRFAEHSHNFLTHDGDTPAEIGRLARSQVAAYENVTFVHDTATTALSGDFGFIIKTKTGTDYTADKIILACGLEHQLPVIEGYEACWGKSALHCPYCHGYEFKNQPTAILFDDKFSTHYLKLIHHLSQDLVMLTNGANVLSATTKDLLAAKNIAVHDEAVVRLGHQNGALESIELASGKVLPCRAIYSARPVVYHNDLALDLGCDLGEGGYIKRDGKHETNRKGVYACGDVAGASRSIAVAVAAGNLTGMSVHEALITDRFDQ